MPARILVVDDNEDIAHSTATVLGAMGYPVRAVTDFGAAVQAFQAFDPVVILTDLRGGGEQLLAHVLSHPTPPKVVVISGWVGRPGVREGLLGRGVSECLPKPVEPMELVRLVEELSGKESFPEACPACGAGAIGVTSQRHWSATTERHYVCDGCGERWRVNIPFRR